MYRVPRMRHAAREAICLIDVDFIVVPLEASGLWPTTAVRG